MFCIYSNRRSPCTTPSLMSAIVFEEKLKNFYQTSCISNCITTTCPFIYFFISYVTQVYLFLFYVSTQAFSDTFGKYMLNVLKTTQLYGVSMVVSQKFTIILQTTVTPITPNPSTKQVNPNNTTGIFYRLHSAYIWHEYRKKIPFGQNPLHSFTSVDRIPFMILQAWTESP